MGTRKTGGSLEVFTLNDIALTALYFHDGSAGTLEEVVEFYTEAAPQTHRSPKMRPLELSEGEKRELVAFLRSLTGEIPL